jgi:hypothetical protein
MTCIFVATLGGGRCPWAIVGSATAASRIIKEIGR